MLRKIFLSIFVLGLLVMLGLKLWVELKTASALESAARAVQTQATSQAVSTVGLTLVIGLLTLLVFALSVVVAVLLRRGLANPEARRMTVPTVRTIGQGKGAWLPGPNAHWGKQPTLPSGFDQLSSKEIELAQRMAAYLNISQGSAIDDDGYEELFS